MHLDIEGYHTSIAPHLLVRIFVSLHGLKGPDTTTLAARVTLTRHMHHRQKPYEVCVTLTRTRQTLQARQRGTMLDTTVETALEDIADQLDTWDEMR